MKGLLEFVNELGEEVLGVRWLPLRRHVERLLTCSPLQAAFPLSPVA